MITFNCSCGKKYQLPDRVAGREVRCNQCGKSLIVPTTSQSEPDNSPAFDDSPTSDSSPKPHVPPPPLPTTPPTTSKPWGSVPVPNGEKNEQSPIITGWQTGHYQKSRSCLLTLVLLLLGSGLSFFAGFIVGGFINETKKMKPESIVESAESAEAAQTFTVADWKIDDKSLTSFAVDTADGGKIQLSLDGNPLEVKENKNALDDVADALATETEKEKKKSEHNQSLRIFSESGNELRLVLPAHGSLNATAEQLKEICFSLHIPDTANAGFNPRKPNGIDKVLVLASLSLRLVSESGYIEFVPENKDKFVSLCDNAKNGWVSVQIPLSGNEIWKRVEHGIFGQLTVKRIELYAQPTGTGAAIWIYNLKMNE
jgi:hypothetical protein